MFEQKQQEAFRWNETVATVAASLLLAGMMACLGVTLAAFGARLFPGWDGSYLPWLGFFIGLEAIFSEGRVHRQTMFSTNRLVYRFSEIILLTIALKFGLIFLRGQSLIATLNLWRDDFLFNFLAGEFGGVWLVMMGMWAVTSAFSSLVYNLLDDTELLKPGSEPQYFSSRREMRRQLAGRILFLGAVMVILTALTRADLKAVWGALPPVEVGAVNVLLYFFLALLLLSQGQFAVLRATWIWQRIPVTRPMAMGWLRYSLIFLAVIALLVLVLPTSYSVGLFPLIKILFSTILTILYFLFLVVSLPILWLLNLLNRQRGLDQTLENPFENLLPTPEPDTVTPIASVPFPELAKSILFWTLFLLVSGYALVQYFRQHKELVERLRRIPGLRWLTEGWLSFWTWLRGATQTVTEIAAAGWARVRPKTRSGTRVTPWSLRSPNRLPPRERVRFFYLAMVRRAQENGHPRGAAETPSEYAATLHRALPDADPDVQAISEAFIQARYTQHPISEADAGHVKTVWARLRAGFKNKK